MNIVKTLIFENEYNSENRYHITSLAKELGERLSEEFKELESIEVDREGDVIFNWEDSLIDDYSRQDYIKNEFFSLFKKEAKEIYPEWF